MKTEYAIKYLDDLAEKPANQQKLSWDMVEAIRAGRDALQENEQLKELLRLAVAGIEKCCDNCINDNVENHCGSNTVCRNCFYKNWQWQHADKLKGLVEV